MSHSAPSPMAYAILLTLLAFVGSLAVGEQSMLELVNAWAAGGQGFWSFLGFAMQMTLILVTGTVVAESPAARKAISTMAQRANGPRQSVVLVSVAAMLVALIHWGLGLIVGAVLAREVGRVASERGSPVHYPALAAGGYSGLLVWHGGLSGSAPLKVTTEADLTDVLGAELAAQVGTIPLEQTLFSPRNALITTGLLIVIPTVLALLVPRDQADFVAPPPPAKPIDEALTGNPLDTGPWLLIPFVGLMAVWVVSWAADGGMSKLSPNALNFIFFGLGLALAGSPARYMALAKRGAAAATGILIQFPLYAGIRGLLVTSGLGATLTSWGSSQLLLSTFFSAGLLNFFVPSGGGQWGIQGPIAMAEAVAQGIEPSRIVLAVAWGDQWTNAFQPFWALPLLGITGAKAGDLLAATLPVGLAAGAVMILGVLL